MKNDVNKSLERRFSTVQLYSQSEDFELSISGEEGTYYKFRSEDLLYVTKK